MARVLPPPPNSSPGSKWGQDYIRWSEELYERVRFKGYLGTLDETYNIGPGNSGNPSNQGVFGFDTVYDTENCAEVLDLSFAGDTSDYDIGTVLRVPEGITKARFTACFYVDLNGAVQSDPITFVGITVVPVVKILLQMLVEDSFLQNQPGMPNYESYKLTDELEDEHQIIMTSEVVEVEHGDTINIQFAGIGMKSGNIKVHNTDDRSWFSAQWLP